MFYEAIFIPRVVAVRIRRRIITISGQPREFVTLAIEGPRAIDQCIITLDPGPADSARVQIIEEETE